MIKTEKNKTFHIVNPYPPNLGFILEAISEIIGVKGAIFVDNNEFNIKEMTALEKKAWKNIEVYALYMYNEPYFHSNNTLHILNDFGIKCPKITKEFIYKLINYAINNNWENKKNKVSNPELCLGLI